MSAAIFLIQSGPEQITIAQDALNEAQAIIKRGHTIKQVFFYGPATQFASQGLAFPAGCPNLQQAWIDLSLAYPFPLVVCSSVSRYYGLDFSDKTFLHPAFEAGGLTDFITSLYETESLWQHETGLKQALNSQGPLVFNFTTSSNAPAARQGLDMLLTAASLDIPIQACYDNQSENQLYSPENESLDLLKKIEMLPDIFDFEDFYLLIEQELTLQNQEEAEAPAYRVPVKRIQTAALELLLNQSKHILRF